MTSPRRPRKPEIAAARWSRPVLPLVLIVAAGLCTYWNSLGAPFIWDDQTAIVTNQSIRQLWPLSDSLLPPGETPVTGRPVVNLSLAVSYAMGGLDAAMYHAFNLAVHILCALVLFGIVRRTVKSGGVALAAALLWMVHPLVSETIDYATERSESMMALFVLLTLYCAIRAREGPAKGGHRRDSGFGTRDSNPKSQIPNPVRWELAAIVSCALGMATKESAVVAPVLVLLYDRVFLFGSIADALRARKALYTGLALTWIELGALMLHAERSTVSVTGSIGPWTYLLNQAQVIVRYLWLTIWPRALVLDYGLPRPVSLGQVAPAATVVLALVAATIVALIRWPAIGFLGAAFFLTLAPTSSIVPVLSEVGAERRMYLPLAALVVLAVVLGRSLIVRLKPDTTGIRDSGFGIRIPNPESRIPVVSAFRRTGRVGGAVVTLVAVALAARTVCRNREYATPLSLWRTVVERRPHDRARMSYGTELVNAGQHDEAVAQLRLAVSDFPDARYALGTELIVAGQVDEGTRELQEFVRRQPSRPDRIPARLLLGRAFLSQGKLGEAADQFRAVLDMGAANPLARQGMQDVIAEHLARAATALREENADAAAGHAREALRLDAKNVPAHNLLGVALASRGKLDEAVVEFRAALAINPNDQQAKNNLARAMGLLRR